MATTYHLSDCLQACNKCTENYHEQFKDVCPTCYSELLRENNLMTKQLNELVTVSEIAYAISKDWQNISLYAKDYLNAMKEITDIDGAYYADSAKSVVMYFLANASSYRGENARTYKALLKEMIK